MNEAGKKEFPNCKNKLAGVLRNSQEQPVIL